MTFDKKVKILQTWLDIMSVNGYEVISVASTRTDNEIDHTFQIMEGKTEDFYLITVRNDGRLINQNGEDLLIVARDSFSNDDAMLEAIDALEKEIKE